MIVNAVGFVIETNANVFSVLRVEVLALYQSARIDTGMLNTSIAMCAQRLRHEPNQHPQFEQIR